MYQQFPNSTYSNYSSDYFGYNSQGSHRHHGTPSDICSNTTLISECDTWNIHGYVIQSPALLPTCLGALIIGMTLAYKVRQMKTRNYLFYATIFAMVGTMMTFAGITDCLIPHILPKNIAIHYFFGIVDVGLTSSIGYAFLIAGLLDCGVLSQDSPITWALLGSGMTAIFYGWWLSFTGAWKAGFFILYMVVIAIGCGAWVIIQFTLIILDKDWKSLKWLLFAGAHGGFGLYSIMSQKIITWICRHVGCHWAINFIWFVVTDTAIYFIYRYYQSRVRFEKVPSKKSLTNVAADETNVSIHYNAIN